MSKNQDNSEVYPTAPPSFDESSNQAGLAPPSYDECVKNDAVTGRTHQYMYSNPTPYQQQQAFQPLPHQTQKETMPFHVAGPSTSYGYANPYQAHIQQQQSYLNMTPPVAAVQPKSAENVLYLAKGAKVRTTANGAISIPPPPPGCAPTPGQLAAMSGQPVMIKKQKKSFF